MSLPIIFFAIMAASVGVALLARTGMRNSSMGEYLVGGRSFPPWLLYFLAVGEIYSIGTMIGLPSGIYAHRDPLVGRPQRAQPEDERHVEQGGEQPGVDPGQVGLGAVEHQRRGDAGDDPHTDRPALDPLEEHQRHPARHQLSEGQNARHDDRTLRYLAADAGAIAPRMYGGPGAPQSAAEAGASAAPARGRRHRAAQQDDRTVRDLNGWGRWGSVGGAARGPEPRQCPPCGVSWIASRTSSHIRW